jgi:hypothetical protein
MARLIEIQNIPELPSRVTCNTGDLLQFNASGAHILAGADRVENLGSFLPGLMLTNGEILSPLGAPSKVMVLARFPGNAEVEIITGDPWYSIEKKKIELLIENK